MATPRASPLCRLGAGFAALLCLLVVVVEIPTVHTHQAGSAGLYNEECLLERLATAPVSAVLTLALEALEPLPAVRARVRTPSLPAPLARPVRPADPRAPPVA
jgi:hypothetical protein